MRFRVHFALPLLWVVVVLGVAAPAAAQPPAPTNLVATPFWSESELEGRVRLDWEYPESQSPRFSPAWEYQYRYRPLTGTYPQDGRPDGWPSTWTDLTGDTPGQFPSGASRSGTVGNLTRQGSYQFRLRVKAGGGSPAGAQATAEEVAVSSSPELPPIARLVATGGDGFVTLDWRDYPPLILAIGQEVRWDWRRRVVGGAWEPFSIRDVPGEPCGIGYPPSLPATVRRIELRNVEAGRTYEYQLRIRRAEPVYDAMGNRTGTACYHGRVSPTSNPVTPGGAGSLQPPTDLRVFSTRAGTLTVSWTSPVPPPYQYLVQYATRERENESTVWRIAGTPPGTTETFTLSGLTDGDPYTIRVCSQGADGEPPPPLGDGSGEHCAVTQGTAGLPNKPPLASELELPNLTLAIGAVRIVDLVGAFTDPDGDVMTYSAQSNAPAVAAVTGPGEGQSVFTITGESAGIATVTVTARDTANPARPAVRIFEVTVALVAPPAPESLRAELEGHGAAAVFWTVLPAWWSVTGYELNVGGPNGAELPFESPLTGLAFPPVTLEPLQPGRYSIQVRAVNAVGDGPWSAAIALEVPVPPLLTVGLGHFAPLYDPAQCSPFEQYSRARGRLDVELSRPARYDVTGVLESASPGIPVAPDGSPWLDIRGGRCPGVSGQGCFRIPAGESAVSLTIAFSCAVVEEQLVSVAFSERLPPRRAGSRPSEIVAITPGKSRIEVKAGVPVPALPAVGVLFLALFLGAVAWVRGRPAA